MFLELKDCIKDAFDPAMKSYVESDDYRLAQREFNKMFYAFRAELTQEQCKKLNEMVNALDDLHASLASEAYYRGVIDGIELHNDTK